MALVIENARAEELAYQLSIRTGQTIEEVTLAALEASLQKQSRVPEEYVFAQKSDKECEGSERGVSRILEAAHQFRDGISIQPFDYDHWLYDQNGLPH